MLGRPRLAGARRSTPTRSIPELTAPHRAVAGRRRPPSRWSPSCFSALRWQKVLDALGLHAGLRRLLSHYLAGQFVSNVLPTTIGGDVLRVSRLSKETGESPELVRLGGARAPHRLARAADHQRRRLPREPAACSTSAPPPASPSAWPSPRSSPSCVLLARGRQRASAGASPPATAGAGSSAPSTSASTACATTRAPPSTSCSSGFAYQFALVLAAVAAAQALGLGEAAGLTALLAFFPAVAIAQVLPIGISGLGVREGAFVLFLGPLGVATEEAIALGPAAVPAEPRREPARRPGLRRRRARSGTPDAPAVTRLTCADAARRRPASHSPVDRRARADAGRRRRARLRWWREVALRRRRVRRVLGRCGTGSARPAATRARPSSTPWTIIDVEQWMHLYFEAHVQSWYLDLPGRGLIRALERVLRHRPLPRHARRARCGCSAATRSATRCGATRWRFTTCLAVVGFAAYSLMPPAPARRPRRVRRLPDLRARGGRRRRHRGRRAGLRPLRLRRHGRPSTAGGSRSATRATRTSRTSTRRCRACTSAGRRGARCVLVPLAPPAVGEGRSPRSTRSLTLFCIVVTGNHYWIDGLGGLVCLAARLSASRRLVSAARLSAGEPSSAPCDGADAHGLARRP